MLPLYWVTVHNSNEWCDDVVESKRMLSVRAANPRDAAAQARIDVAGRTRREFLADLGAPRAIMQAQTCLRHVAHDLTSLTDEAGPRWKLDNGVEMWLFVVSADGEPYAEVSRLTQSRLAPLPNWRVRTAGDLLTSHFENNRN